MRKQRGITLIALVVTIVVLLILAAFSIAMLRGDNGIISNAKKSKEETVIGQEKETVEISYVSAAVNKMTEPVTADELQAELEKTAGVNKTITTTNDDSTLNVEFIETKHNYNVNNKKVTKVEEIEETFSEIATEDRIYTDPNGEQAIIPKGFGVGTSDTINKVKDGLVIQDEDGNQFVWIPASGYVGNGFYIGRFEAGSETERTEKTTTNTKPVVKRDKFAYNYVNYDNAVSLCEEMYQNVDSVDSTLAGYFDIQNAMSFIGSVNDRLKGNFYESTFNVSRGKYAMIKDDIYQTPYTPYYSEDTELYKDVKGVFTKPVTTQVIFTTGATDRNKVKNIFDIFGNVMEWNKADYQDEWMRTTSGGAFVKYYQNSYKSQINDGQGNIIKVMNSLSKQHKIIFVGFRPVLYINEGAYIF